MENYQDFLKSVEHFQELDDGEIRLLNDVCRLETYAAGSIVIAEGDRRESFYIIKSGSVSIYKRFHEPDCSLLAELGLGVLSDFGLLPTGEILLDEKLGLHIAFGRSDHFGGSTGPSDFTSPDQVVHIDRVFLPEIQPRVHVASVDLVDADGNVRPLMRDHKYVIDFK